MQLSCFPQEEFSIWSRFRETDNVDEPQEFPFGFDVADSKFLSPSIFTFIVVQAGGGEVLDGTRDTFQSRACDCRLKEV